MAPDPHCEIRVLESLDRHWTAWFEGLQVNSDGSQAVVCGPVADQAALYGRLNKVCGVGFSTPARPRVTTARHRTCPRRREEVTTTHSGNVSFSNDNREASGRLPAPG